MLSENIKNIRIQKGLSQNELAVRLHVVRQTVSKWEKGLSVPDAETLSKIADILETDVATLLGTTINPDHKQSDVAEQLARVNEQLIVSNRRSSIIWRVVAVLLIILLIWFLWTKFETTKFYLRMVSPYKPIDLSYTCEITDSENHCVKVFEDSLVSKKGRFIFLNYHIKPIRINFKDENGEVLFGRTIKGGDIDTFNVKANKPYYLEITADAVESGEEIKVLVFDGLMPSDAFEIYGD